MTTNSTQASSTVVGVLTAHLTNDGLEAASVELRECADREPADSVDREMYLSIAQHLLTYRADREKTASDGS